MWLLLYAVSSVVITCGEALNFAYFALSVVRRGYIKQWGKWLSFILKINSKFKLFYFLLLPEHVYTISLNSIAHK
jgi:hypothetical protein